MNQTKLYLNPNDTAQMLYLGLKELYRREESGSLFLPWSTAPALVGGNEYFTKDKASLFSNFDAFTQITDLGSVTGIKENIFDINGRLVLRARDTRLVVTDTVRPLVELNIIEALIENELKEASAWIDQRDKVDPYDVVRGFVIGPITYDRNTQHNHHRPKYEDWADEGIIRTLQTVEPLIKEVNRFVGDDNYMIHTVSRLGIDFVIEKTIDYRISEYERLKAEGIIP